MLLLTAPNTAGDPRPLEASRHHYFDHDICKDMVTAYLDGCTFHHETLVHAGVRVVWVNNNPYEPKNFQLGSQSSQYPEIAGILIILKLAAAENIKTLVICTDSN